ncbi:hypothetical protein IQ07DRAFT_637071 [Pyrenochaeta sp. DS3sAY3a]|nr:hypothetical protein IQ07DRAFT_637071 [Pyrenochaeta sp. DS3sAY3a]
MSFLPSLLQPKRPVLRTLDIRLDTPTVSVRRDAHERYWVHGRVVFLNSSNVRVTSVTVSLTGVQQTLWYTDTMTADRIRSKDVIFCKERTIYRTQKADSTSTSCAIGAGNFVWPFEFDLGASPFESIDGLGNSFVNYEIRATLATAGPFSKKLSARRQIKVFRSPSTEEMDDLGPEQEAHSSWPDKLNYRISAPSRHHQWGQPINTEFTLQPLVKGITIEAIGLSLKESLLLNASSSKREQYSRKEKMISEVEATVEENPALQSWSISDTLEKTMEMVLPLPRSVYMCRQSIHQGRIMIAHSLLVDLRIRDDGSGQVHRASHAFPIVLTFPVGIAFNDDGFASIPHELAHLQKDAQGVFTGLCAPPAFGKHRSDPIFRPGLYLASHDPGQEQLASEGAPGGPEQHTILRTKHLSRFVFPHVVGRSDRCVR